MHNAAIINQETGEITTTAVVEMLTPNTVDLNLHPCPSCDYTKGQAMYWINGKWEVRVKNSDLFFSYIRTERDALIAETDWTQSIDVKLSAELKDKVTAYRQTLRDVTKQDPNNFAWPVNPLAK